MAEIMLVIGLALILFNLKNYVFIWNKPIKLVAFFISITGIWFLFGLGRYPLVELLQDAFMFFYAFFIFIVFLASIFNFIILIIIIVVFILSIIKIQPIIIIFIIIFLFFLILLKLLFENAKSINSD